MVKKISAKIGEYEKDGQKKGRYVQLGVILSNQKGEYLLLDPTVNLAGVLMQQRILSQQTGGKSGDKVLCSIFDEDSRQQSQGSGQGGGYAGGQGSTMPGDMDDSEIPF